MKQHRIFTSIALSALIVGAAAAQESKVNRMKMSSADNTFVTKAAQGGMAEVDLGNLASQKATNQAVKDFGKQMVTDHSKANEELKSIASAKGMTVPSGMDAKSMSLKTHLSGLSGAAFDRAYMEDMVKDHKEDISEFQKEADSGADSDIKAFAQKTLPTLQQHLQMAQKALDAVKQ